MGKWATAAIYMLAMAGVWFWREELLQWIESLKSSRDAATAVQMFVLASIASLFPLSHSASSGHYGSRVRTLAGRVDEHSRFDAGGSRHVPWGSAWLEGAGQALSGSGRTAAQAERHDGTSPGDIHLHRPYDSGTPAIAINVYAALVSVPFVSFCSLQRQASCR